MSFQGRGTLILILASNDLGRTWTKEKISTRDSFRRGEEKAVE